MEILMNFINEYGATILYAIITFIAGYVGLWLKNLATKYINDKTKKEVVLIVVKAVQQLYKDLGGEEKLDKAIESATEMLAEKGITITELELRMLIEAAVKEIKDQVAPVIDPNEPQESFDGEEPAEELSESETPEIKE